MTIPPLDGDLEDFRPMFGTPSDVGWTYSCALLNHTRPKSIRIDAIARKVSNEPLPELHQQVYAALSQILCRAHMGDVEAIISYDTIARGMVGELNRLIEAQPEKVQTRAETCAHWPVLLSLNPQEIESAKAVLRRLQVGTKAITPTGPSQRLNPNDFWTMLAKDALNACQWNQSVVPSLERFVAGLKGKQRIEMFWHVPSRVTIFTLPTGDVITIPRWAKQCVQLSKPLTKDNFSEWWGVLKLCVLHYWYRHRNEYETALGKIGRENEDEWRRRNGAITAVRQAFRSCVGLH